MTERDKREQSYNDCRSPESHREHLCHLMDRGMTEEVRRLSSQPQFFCGNCGARANMGEDLCNPKSLPDQPAG